MRREKRHCTDLEKKKKRRLNRAINYGTLEPVEGNFSNGYDLCAIVCFVSFFSLD